MEKIIEFCKSSECKDEDISIEMNRTEKFFEIAQELSDFIHDLPLTHEQNNKLINLMIDQVQEAERSAFGQGFYMGVVCERFEISED